MFAIKCLPSSYHPYLSKWFFYYGEDRYGANTGMNVNLALKCETYREALDKAKNLWDNYRYETMILKV